MVIPMARLGWIIRFIFIVIGAVLFVLYLQESNPDLANTYLLAFIIVLVIEVFLYFIIFYLRARNR